MSDLIDIIVLSYNNSPVSESFISHLYSNTDYDRFNVFWLDNGSTDSTKDLLTNTAAKHSNFILHLEDKNLGVIGGRNKASSICLEYNSDDRYMIFLDNDQFVQEGWLDQHIKSLEITKSDVVGSEAWLMSDRKSPIRMASSKSDKWTYIGAGGMMLKKELFRTIGPFDDIYSPAYFEDPDFCYKCYKEGCKFTWNYKSRIIHKAHQTLGGNKDSRRIFLNSYAKFVEKWKEYPLLQFTSPYIPS